MKIKISKREQYKARSGVYIGGIGAGGFEVRPDGSFHRCQIFNNWLEDSVLNAMFLFQKEYQNWILGLDELNMPAKVVQGVNKIVYTGEFPLVKLFYPEQNIHIEYISYFIPGDLRNSSLPGISFKIKANGNMIFLLGSPYSCQAIEKKQKIFLKSKQGTIGIHSKNGRTFCSLLHRGLINAFIEEGSYKIPSWMFQMKKNAK